MPLHITPLVLTFNEAPNIARTLARLDWAAEIVVVDSGSTDATREILSRYPNVRVFQRPFTTHAEQWNFGLAATGISTDWVLALDADHGLSRELIAELASLDPDPGVGGYEARFVYCMQGYALRAAAYPPVVVLYRRAGAHYIQDGHTQRVQVPGAIVALQGTIAHDDRKPLGHWLSSQVRYMRLEAAKLRATPAASLSVLDRIRRLIVVAPAAMFCYCYIVRGGVFDGLPGLYYALQRATAEAILSLHLMDEAMSGRRPRD